MDDRPTTVLFIWDVDPRLRERLTAELVGSRSVRLVFPSDLSPQRLVALAPEADVIVGWRPTDQVLEAAARLKLLINPGAGVQHVADRVRRIGGDRGVRLANGHGNANFTAQHAVALLLALTNRVVQHHNWMVEGRWRTGDADAASVPLRGRTVGLLGYGAVNRNVHRMLAGFDVRFAIMRRSWPQQSGPSQSVVGTATAAATPAATDVDGRPGYRPRRFKAATRYLGLPPSPPLRDTDLRFAAGELDELLAAADVLVAAVPLTPETDGLIGRAELDALGADGLLVQMSRGRVVDEHALFAALRDGVIAGAAIDVWYDYKPEPDADGRRYPYSRDCPFHSLPNVVLSPHRGASPFSDLQRWDEVVENIKRVAAGRDDLLNLVDLELGY